MLYKSDWGIERSRSLRLGLDDWVQAKDMSLCLPWAVVLLQGTCVFMDKQCVLDNVTACVKGFCSKTGQQACQ